jgi:hypothetical protein
MAIATFDELRRTARLDAADRERLAKSLGGKNLFLSHSLSDLDHVKYAVDLLEQNGARVYIDVADASIANANATDAAKRLRNAIRETRRLVVLVTENTKTSRWIPWEMGLADATTGVDRIALLPLRSSGTASELWAKQEYFELYARIERYVTGSSTSWIVSMPGGGAQYLSNWLDNTRPR